MKRGEVWRVRLPTGAGHAQSGERPAIIIQNDANTARLPTVLIVPLTSSRAALRFPGTAEIQPDGQNGLTVASVALGFQTTALDKQFVLRRLGVLNDADLARVLQLIADLTS